MPMNELSSILTDPEATDAEVLEAVASVFRRSLSESEKPREWLEVRGLLDDDTLSTLEVGYADAALGKLVPRRNQSDGPMARGRLTGLGVYRTNGKLHPLGALTFPVRDAAGRITAFFGKRFGQGLGASTERLPVVGDHNALWNAAGLEAAGVAGSLVICPTIEDSLACIINGWPATTWVRDDAHLRAILPRLRELGVNRITFTTPTAFAEVDAMATIVVRVPYGKGLWYFLRKSEFPKAALKELLNLKLNHLPPPPAPSPVPESDKPVEDGTMDEKGEIHFEFGGRCYRVRGLEIDESWNALKVNIRVDVGDRCHVDLVDLYSAKQRAKFIQDAAAETGEGPPVVKSDVGRILRKLEDVREELSRKAESPGDSVATMSDEERREAMGLLTDPNLLDRIVEDFRTCGLVGEDANALFGYVASVSRKLDDPISIIIQSSSSAGKSSLMEAIIEFVPPEERMHVTAMTAQSLYYVGRNALKHKTISISESEGMQRADYALKLLQSEKRLSIATTGRDARTGRQMTQHYEVEGPVQTIVTTTAGEIDEELQNRSVVLSVGEGRDQTRAIHERQRRGHTLAGILAGFERESIIRKHRNAHRLLRPVMVVNPFAAGLTFADSQVRHRRDHAKYLNLISAITFLHQHRREVHTVLRGEELVAYVETTEEDVRAANQLMTSVLAQSVDELAPQTRRLLSLVRELATRTAEDQGIDTARVRMTRRRIREFTCWNDTRLRKHLGRLAVMEYLLVHRKGKRFVEYEVLAECDDLPVVELSAPTSPQDSSRTVSHPMRTPFAPPEGALGSH
jgi:DNA primase